jgi:selenocysteine lyase/cysteine desulfurase
MVAEISLEEHFAPFREKTIGRRQKIASPGAETQVVYADWTASGRGYEPIECCLQQEVLPFFANSHTQTTLTGTLMTKAYEEAKVIVKQHVGANAEDVLIFCGSGMTSAVNKLQRLLGLKMPARSTEHACAGALQVDDDARPVIFVTRMEHHSNHISWLETIATVVLIDQTEDGNVDLDHFDALLEQFKCRVLKIAAVTACSNVTGIQTPYHEIAKRIHRQGGLCFVDFACSAPYVQIDMHPADEGERLDAIYFSMHKFLGGPGTPGVLIFNGKLYHNAVPDHPGGGTILYSNPWKVRQYVDDIEAREDGGTPPLLQAIKAAMCIRLKEQMGINHILRREEELMKIVLDRLSEMERVTVLQGNVRTRLGVVSFVVAGAHHNLIVKLLNDRFGIQTRGGCSCAGTYGHALLGVEEKRSLEIRDAIISGDMFAKPGWVRVSIHPTMSDDEINFILVSIEATAFMFAEWMRDYTYDKDSNEYIHRNETKNEQDQVERWFEPSSWIGSGVKRNVTMPR